MGEAGPGGAREGRFRPIPEPTGLAGCLATAWRRYLGYKRHKELDAEIAGMLTRSIAEERPQWLRARPDDGRPTTAERPWPSFHRSITRLAVDKAFTIAQQHALAVALGVPATPPFDTVMQWQREQDHLLSAMRGSAGWTNNPSFLLEACRHDWPLAAVGEGECYTRLMGHLDKVRAGRLAGKPIKADHTSHLIVDDVIKVMEQVFDHHFPDDPAVDLLTAVRTYRAFSNSTSPHSIRALADRAP